MNDKNAIRKVPGPAYITFEAYVCILCEAETTISDQPITFVDSNINNMNPLTPSWSTSWSTNKNPTLWTVRMWWLEGPLLWQQTHPLLERNKQLCKTLARFWNKWMNEYLMTLRERYGQHHKTRDTENNITPGDIVLVHADVKKHLRWDMPVIQSLITGNDGIARAAIIKIRTGHTTNPCWSCTRWEMVSQNNHVTKKRRISLDQQDVLPLMLVKG